MDLSTAAKTTMTFAGVLATLSVLDVSRAHANPDWGSAPPSAIADIVNPTILIGVLVGLLVITIGISLIWQQRRAGLVLVGCVALIEGVGNIFAGFGRIVVGFPVT